MKCAWKELLSILPGSIKSDVDRLGKEYLQELRLRLGQPVELVLASNSQWLKHITTEQDIAFIVNTASRYSPWSAPSAASGYITAVGGHRIGLAGDVVTKDGHVTGIRCASSLCVRVARDYAGIGKKAAELSGNILILGPPGSGKTTLLRDVIRHISESVPGSIAVVDERGELFPMGFDRGYRTDVLTGCGKAQGVEMALRTMGPSCIAVDEITAQRDCQALTQAGWCGVRLLATAHAANKQDLKSRPVYQPLWECGLFESLVILRKDKSWYMERMLLCP